MHRRTLLAGLAAGLASPAVLRAQSAWPDRPIRLIVPWPPGGSTDTIARIFQPKLAEVLGKPVIIDNRGGASGSIGAIEAARSAPDGSTWMLAYDNEATNQTLFRLPYKALEAFAPVSLVADGPLALVAHQSTPTGVSRTWSRRRRRRRIRSAMRARASAAWRMSDHAAAAAGRVQPGACALSRRRAGPAGRDRRAGAASHVERRHHQPAHQVGTLRPLGVTTAGETRHVPG